MVVLLAQVALATERLGFVMGAVGGWAYLFCAIFITFDVISRRFIGFSSQSTTEVSSYLLAFGISWGLTYALTTRGHIRVDVFVQRMPARFRAYLHVAAVGFLTLLAGLFARRAWDLTFESWAFQAHDASALSVPLILPQGLWAIGITVFAIACILMFLENVLLLIVGRLDTVDERLGPRTVHEETEEAREAVGLLHPSGRVSAPLGSDGAARCDSSREMQS
jgi:TRAP-type C4-dicarboxylate transport system permease small subunit